MDVINWLNSKDYARNRAAEDRRLFTSLELQTRGSDDAEYARIYLDYVCMYLGQEAFAKWLAGLDTPIDEIDPEDIRALAFRKYQEVAP